MCMLTRTQILLEVPKVHWTDIGGQEDIKQRLKESVEWPLQVNKEKEMIICCGTLLTLIVLAPRSVCTTWYPPP